MLRVKFQLDVPKHSRITAVSMCQHTHPQMLPNVIFQCVATFRPHFHKNQEIIISPPSRTFPLTNESDGTSKLSRAPRSHFMGLHLACIVDKRFA